MTVDRCVPAVLFFLPFGVTVRIIIITWIDNLIIFKWPRIYACMNLEPVENIEVDVVDWYRC